MSHPVPTDEYVCDDCGEDLMDCMCDAGADKHTLCYGYPNCDVDPLGCRFKNKAPEPCGHRD